MTPPAHDSISAGQWAGESPVPAMRQERQRSRVTRPRAVLRCGRGATLACPCCSTSWRSVPVARQRRGAPARLCCYVRPPSCCAPAPTPKSWTTPPFASWCHLGGALRSRRAGQRVLASQAVYGGVVRCCVLPLRPGYRVLPTSTSRWVSRAARRRCWVSLWSLWCGRSWRSTCLP